ncbi:hypothetical protein LAZ67_12001208 [Cordylochernes scorpioides]|uniref:Tc1-like transposase DDE domain-containing protein n=1 Tax=Cordylochernes scorpioides TaxID=51811 RepID=A0ABY6L5Y6_9ARAC|nr:hypothetical protein LAZ67_12001208 [Cordylochernes scorpioides]
MAARDDWLPAQHVTSLPPPPPPRPPPPHRVNEISRLTAEQRPLERVPILTARGAPGRQNVHDDERSGSPVTATDNAAVAAVRNVVEADRRVTIDEIMIRLPPGIEIRRSSIGTIMSDVLNFLKVCTRWVPRLLLENHKQQRMEAARAFLEMHQRDGDQLFSRIVTGDESWVHHSTPETKRQSMVWKKPEESAPKKGEGDRAAQKLFAKFKNGDLDLEDTPRSGRPSEFDEEHLKALLKEDGCQTTRVLYWEMFERNATVNKDLYIAQLHRVDEAIQQKKPDRQGQIILLHDNARPHVAQVVKAALQELEWEVLQHPPYSPDLAPTDYHLFRSMSNHMRGTTFDDEEDLKTWLNNFFDTGPGDFWRNGINKLVERWEDVVNKNGEYIID